MHSVLFMQYLSNSSNVILLVSFALGCLSVIFFWFGRPRLSIITLITASFILGILFATLDPFLHLWDEQFHAMVSKNLMKHWLKPTLYENPILNYDYKLWGSNHIWLHKQPLFLWQMALSQYFFGNTELGIRFPDVIMHAMLTFLVFDIGRIVKNEKTGFLAALFFTFLNYPLELTSGRMGLDHNDFAFMFYITASFWAYFKYRETNVFLWVLFIGLFVGCAVLVKWLAGLLIYLCWGIYHIYENRNLKSIFINSKPIIISLLVAFMVFMPWQIYCYMNFRNEFKHEMLYNSMHISNAIEGHKGTWIFYFTELSALYGDGDLVPYILLFSFLFFIYDKKQSKHNKIIIATAVLFIYFFFTIVKTKMTAFPVIVLPLILIILANFISELTELTKNKLVNKVIFSIAAIVISLLFFNLNTVLKKHTLTYKPNENAHRDQDLSDMEKIKRLNDLIKDKNIVIFNCKDLQIKIMYYCNFTAYGFMPSINECQIVQNKGYKIAVLKRTTLPDYIENDQSILKINF